LPSVIGPLILPLGGGVAFDLAVVSDFLPHLGDREEILAVKDFAQDFRFRLSCREHGNGTHH
jgi:hypothetical protein